MPRGMKTRKVKKKEREKKKKPRKDEFKKNAERTAIQEVKVMHLLCNKQEKV